MTNCHLFYILSWYDNQNYTQNEIFFKKAYPIRKIMYTTNIIESIHKQFRKLTKTKESFPNKDSLLKLLFMGIKNAKEKWTQPVFCYFITYRR